MDCADVTGLLSAAEDGECVSAGALALANAHCDACPDCAAFRATLELLGATPAPGASRALVDMIIASIPGYRIEAAVEDLDGPRGAKPGAAGATAVGTRQTDPQTAVGEAPPSHDLPQLERARSRRSPGHAARLVAAAAVLLAIGLTSTVLGNWHGDLAADESSRGEATESASGSTADKGAGAPSGSETDTDTRSTTVATYVAMNGIVYQLVADAPQPESALATAGSVTSSLDTSGTARTLTAYRSAGDEDFLYVHGGDKYSVFCRVSRSVNGLEYVLVTDAALTRFGEWPTLPKRFAAPVGADGSPTFRLAGFDDLGENIYAARAEDVEAGFAIAPGTQSEDPAGGNPGWTWWEPAR